MLLTPRYYLKIKKNEKGIFDLYIDGKKQAGITKPLPYVCIKKKEHPPTLTEFNRILDKISYDDNIEHLFIADIKFNDINPKTLLFNEIYPPIFEKKKKKWNPMNDQLFNL